MNEQLTDSKKIQDICLLDVIKNLWKKRWFIIKVTVVFAGLGIIVASVSEVQYTAGCTVVPQSSEKTRGNGLSGLAAMAGIDLGNLGGGDVLSPKIYSKILSSVPFQKELMNTPITFEDYQMPVTLFDYYTKDEYIKNKALGMIKKYTIGLPGTIIIAFRSKKEEKVTSEIKGRIETMTRDEKHVIEKLSNKVWLRVNDKDGYVQLSASMPEPLAAAQAAQCVQELLQRYITLFKIEKVQSNLDFVQQRFDEVKNSFELKQKQLAIFKDANQELSSEVARTEVERLTNEYNLSFALYSELAKQLEQAKIQVKETMPVFTVIEPVVIPVERSAPRIILIFVAFVVLGGFVGVALVLFLPFIALVSGAKRLRAWLPEEESKNDEMQADTV